MDTPTLDFIREDGRVGAIMDELHVPMGAAAWPKLVAEALEKDKPGRPGRNWLRGQWEQDLERAAGKRGLIVADVWMEVIRAKKALDDKREDAFIAKKKHNKTCLANIFIATVYALADAVLRSKGKRGLDVTELLYEKK
jgi:hypothetical protein